MKNCQNCGAQLDDEVSFCPYCGTNLQTENQPQQQVYQVVNQTSQPGYGNYGQSVQPGYGNYGQPVQPGYGNYGQPVQTGYENYGQPVQPGYENYGQSEKPKKQKKPINKKILIPVAVAAAVAVAALIVCLVLFGGKLTRHKAQKLVDEYVAQIERKDVKGVLFRTVPKGLLARVLEDADMDVDYDEFMEELDDTLDDRDVEEALDDAKIHITDMKVNRVSAFKLEDYIQYVNSMFAEIGAEMTIEEFVSEESGEEINIEKLESQIETALALYNIKLEDVYLVDISFMASIKAEIDGESISESISSAESHADHAIIYKYEDEWYVIPPLDAMLLPSLQRYVDKSRRSSDVSSAKTIKTAVETALCNEYTYEEMSENYCDELIYVTDDGLSKLPSDIEEEIRSNIGDELPEVKYTENGAQYFAFEVTTNGCVYVYVVGEDEDYDIWELCPETDFDYY